MLSLAVTLLPIYGTDKKVSAVVHTLPNPIKNSNGDTIWDCVWFGSYPQAEVIPSGTYTALDSSLLQDGDVIESDSIYNELQNATGWDKNGDIVLNGEKYRRILKSDATYSTSSISYYNWSDSESYHYFKYEPIKWRVLNVNDNDAFLLADRGSDNQKYNESNTFPWEKSDIRSWLNGYDTGYDSKNFIETAFSDSERADILASEVE